MITNKLGISREIDNHYGRLGDKKICAKMVPRLLNEDQMEGRVQVCHDILERLKIEPDLLKRVVTSDESCIVEYDQETKRLKDRALSGCVKHHLDPKKRGNSNPE